MADDDKVTIDMGGCERKFLDGPFKGLLFKIVGGMDRTVIVEFAMGKRIEIGKHDFTQMKQHPPCN